MVAECGRSTTQAGSGKTYTKWELPVFHPAKEEDILIKFTDEMKENINDSYNLDTPMILGTASASGEPNLSFRGSFMAFDDDHLAYWDRTKRIGLSHIEQNPSVVALLVNWDAGLRWKFFGEAEVHTNDSVREQVMARVVQGELDRDPDRTGYAVVIRVDRITTLSGDIIQARD